jgi:hypothetical protein
MTDNNQLGFQWAPAPFAVAREPRRARLRRLGRRALPAVAVLSLALSGVSTGIAVHAAGVQSVSATSSSATTGRTSSALSTIATSRTTSAVQAILAATEAGIVVIRTQDYSGLGAGTA